MQSSLPPPARPVSAQGGSQGDSGTPRRRVIRGMPMVARKLAHLPPGHKLPQGLIDWLRPRVERAIHELASERNTQGDATHPMGEPGRGDTGPGYGTDGMAQMAQPL